MNNEIKIKRENLQELYKTLTNYPAISKEQVINEMHKCFGEETFKPKDIKERVKTYEDACEVLGISPVLNCPNLCICEKHEETGEMHEYFSFRQAIDRQTLAYLKLCVITAALNEGWEPQFTEDEYRYYPWFGLYTEEDYNNLDDEEKERCCRVVGRASYNARAYGGLVCSSANNVSASSYTSSGSRLAFKSRELALYCGKQFIEIWCDFLF